MADSHADIDHNHVHGEMEISAQSQMYSLFTEMVKWCSLGISSLVLFLVVWFAVGAGFLAGAISAVVLLVAGYIGMRRKPAAH